MDPAATRTAADIGYKSKGRTAFLAIHPQGTASNEPVPYRSPMGIPDELHQLTPLGKGTASTTAATASTSRHFRFPLSFS